MISVTPEPERGFVLAVLGQGVDAEDELAEVRELARTAGVEPVGAVVQHRARPAQRTYVGKGKLEELKLRFRDAGAESLIVDDELDPAQQRFLENTLDTRVIDRTQLILDIFAQHATSAEGKLQVELAQLEYNLPRMRGRLYSSCASSTWSFPSADVACWAKMSRISCVRSMTRVSSAFSRNRCWAGSSSSSTMRLSAPASRNRSFSSSSLPLPT